MSETPTTPPSPGQPPRMTPPERLVPVMVQTPPPAKPSGWRWLLRAVIAVVLLGSIAMNLWLLAALAMTISGPFETAVLREGDEKQAVAVYTVGGVIDGRAAGEFAAFVRLAGKDSDVKAVVLRVDSPGGTVGASDEMYNGVRRLQKAGKKVVVSMGSVAASGGYYISASADAILAEPTTTTGSIGVLANWVALRGTLEKIGAEPVMMQSAHARDWKQSINPVDPPTDRQRAHIQQRLDQMQARFERVVREGRGQKLKVLKTTVPADSRGPAREEEEPFNGKVYGPEEAMALGLVDAMGYEQEAIEKAAELAGLSSPKVVTYGRRSGFVSRLLQGQESDSRTMGLSRDLIDELQTPRILLLWKVQ